jgi:hypothetical protein
MILPTGSWRGQTNNLGLKMEREREHQHNLYTVGAESLCRCR